jgi:hypothetical protein
LHGGKLWAERRDIDALADASAIHEPGSSQAALRGMTFNVVLPFGTG